jgi:hypothetical protein
VAINLSNVLASKFKEIHFPLASVEMDFSLSHQVHQRYLIDGAWIEAMGRAPYAFKLTIPLLNGLTPGKSEKWDSQSLYPETYNDLQAAFADGMSGDFQHPTLGKILCKAVGASDTLQADQRNGVILTVSLIETLKDDESDSGQPLKSPLVQAAAAAKKVAAAVDSRTFSVERPDSVGDLFDSIQAFQDGIALVGKQVKGSLDKYAGKFTRLKDSMGTIGIDPVNQAAFALACELAIDGAHRATELTTKPTAFKIIKVRSSIPSVVKLIGGTLDDFYTLNQSLSGKLVLEVGTLVKFYR